MIVVHIHSKHPEIRESLPLFFALGGWGWLCYRKANGMVGPGWVHIISTMNTSWKECIFQNDAAWTARDNEDHTSNPQSILAYKENLGKRWSFLSFSDTNHGDWWWKCPTSAWWMGENLDASIQTLTWSHCFISTFGENTYQCKRCKRTWKHTYNT